MTDFDVAAAGDETARALTAAHGRIRARRWPADEEELSVDAATRFVAGRLELEEAAAAVRESKAALAAARAELRGAAVAAVECGVPKRKVARDAGVSRMSLDDWLTPREE
nr:MAG TPA: hypothetical protein [Caudoviricetes sp.]